MTGHRRRPNLARWLAAGGAVALAGLVGVALLLQNSGSACAAPPSASAAKGQATFYDLGGDGTGNCSFPKSPADDLFVALGPSQYSAAAACGTYLDVTGPKGKVRVKVTDSCPECAPGHLDLSRTAFKKIADEVDGLVPITYKTVAAPTVPGPLAATIQSGSSQYWLSILIDNHGTQLESVQVAGPSGSFHQAKRADYNFWIIESGLGSGPFKVKIIDVYAHTATLTGIKLAPGKVQSTSARLASTGSSKPAAKASPSPSKTKPSPAATHPSSVPASASPTPESASATATTPPVDSTEAVALAAAPATHC